MPISTRGDDRLGRERSSIGPHDVPPNLDEGRFSVRAITPEHREDVLNRKPSQHVPKQALQKVTHLGVWKNFLQEFQKPRGLLAAIKLGVCHPRHHVRRRVRRQTAHTQIQNPVLHIQQPRVHVKF